MTNTVYHTKIQGPNPQQFTALTPEANPNYPALAETGDVNPPNALNALTRDVSLTDISSGGPKPYNENVDTKDRTFYNTPNQDTSIYNNNTDALTDPKLGVMPNDQGGPSIIQPKQTKTYASYLEKFGL